MSQHHFELHPVAVLGDDPADLAAVPWQPAQRPAAPPPLALEEAGVGVAVDPHTGRLRTAPHAEAAALFYPVPRRLGADLAMVTLTDGVLVNGLPALPLTVLSVKDAVTLAPGCLCYVTERVLPFVGTPAGELLGKQCPFCRLACDEKTRVVTCHCGAPYHFEAADSHPNTPADDRLECFTKVQTCLACNRPLTREPHLLWDPSEL
jgi:hypothetical protein